MLHPQNLQKHLPTPTNTQHLYQNQITVPHKPNHIHQSHNLLKHHTNNHNKAATNANTNKTNRVLGIGIGSSLTNAHNELINAINAISSTSIPVCGGCVYINLIPIASVPNNHKQHQPFFKQIHQTKLINYARQNIHIECNIPINPQTILNPLHIIQMAQQTPSCQLMH